MTRWRRLAAPILAIGALSVSVRTATADWSMFHGDPRHSGASGDRASNTIAWTFQTSDTIEMTSPAVGPDGTIYVANLAGELLALKPPASQKWKLSGLSANRYSTPAVAADGTVYVGGADSSLYAIDPTGTIRWRFRTTGSVKTSPNLGSDGTIYCGADDGKLYAITPAGTLKWSYPTADTIRSSPAIGPDGTIFFGSEDAYFYALNPTGTLRWRALTGAQIKYCSPAVSAAGVVYFGSYDGFLYAMTSAGALQWVYDAAHVLRSSPAIGADGTIFVGVDSDLVAINPVNGARRWKRSTGGVIYSSPAYTAQDSNVVVGSDDSLLYVVHADSLAANYGHIAWTLRLSGGIRSSPAPDAAGIIVVGDMRGKVWALGPTTIADVPVLAPVSALRASPNPSRGEVVFETGPRALQAPIEILDVHGRRVGRVNAGPQGYRWSARQPGRGQVPPGVYFYRFEGGSAAERLVLLR